MLSVLGTLILLGALSYLTSTVIPSNLPALIVFIYASETQFSKLHPTISTVLLALPYIIGKSAASNILPPITKDENSIARLLALCIAALCQGLAIIGANLTVVWLKDRSKNGRLNCLAGIDQFIFPILWFSCQEFLFRWDIQESMSSQASLYPTWLIGSRIDIFLDAIFAACGSHLLQLLFKKRYSNNHLPQADIRGSLMQRIWARYSLTILMVALLCSGGLFITVTSERDPDVLKVGCARPKDFTKTQSVLHAIETEVRVGTNIIVVPASESYISEVPKFIRYKKDIRKMTQDQSTVVVPTMNFRNETACQRRMKLQVYPLGEEVFLNTYTYNMTKKVGSMLREKIDIKSLFLTWRSKRVDKSQGSLLIACAICLESEFPEIFTGDHSPDLLIIPNSAWSASVAGSHIQGIRHFAKRTGTAVLFCETDRSGYVDPTGRTILRAGDHSFRVGFNQRTRGRLPGLDAGLWWLWLSILLVLYRVYVRSSSTYDSGATLQTEKYVSSSMMGLVPSHSTRFP